MTTPIVNKPVFKFWGDPGHHPACFDMFYLRPTPILFNRIVRATNSKILPRPDFAKFNLCGSFCFLFRGFSNSIIEFPNRIDGMLIDFNDDIALLEIFCAAGKFGFTFTISTL